MKRKRLASVGDSLTLFDTCRQIVNGFSQCFVISRVLHNDFANIFLKEWPNTINKKRSNMVTHHSRDSAFSIFLLDEHCGFTQLIATSTWITKFLYSLFTPGGWGEQVKEESEVPPSLWTAIHRQDVRYENLFPLLDVAPHPAELSVCVERIRLWEKNKMGVIIEEEDEEEDESDTLGIEVEENPPTFRNENIRIHLVHGEEEVEDSRDYYLISAVTFSLSAILEKKIDWNARDIYFFFKDWLADYTIRETDHPPPGSSRKIIISAAQCLLRWISHLSPEPSDSIWPIKECEELFIDIQEMLSFTARSHKYPRARLVRFKILTKEETSSLLSGSSDNVVGLAFIRKGTRHRSVSPMQLYCTMEYLQWKFKNKAWWKVRFDSDRTFLLIKKDYLGTIMKLIMPFAAQSAIRREPFPLYPLHLRNYLDENLLGKALAMRFLVQTFSPKTKITLPLDDELVYCYRYLAVIFDRMGSKGEVWKLLTDPFEPPKVEKETKRIMEEKAGSTRSIKRDFNTIYSAIIGLANLREDHYISLWGIDALARVFSTVSRKKFPIPYAIFDAIRYSRDPLDVHALIPPDCLDVYDYPWPPHLALYIFCCAADVPSDEAIEIFLSLSAGTKTIEEGDSTRKKTLPIPVPTLKLRKKSQKILSDEKKKSLRRSETARRKDLERGANEFSDAKKRGEPTVAADFIFQTLEEMFALPGERLTRNTTCNLTSEEILKGSDLVIPIDSDKEGPLYSDKTFPVFSGISREYTFSRIKGGQDACPLVGAHEDFVPCVYTNSITYVQE